MLLCGVERSTHWELCATLSRFLCCLRHCLTARRGVVAGYVAAADAAAWENHDVGRLHEELLVLLAEREDVFHLQAELLVKLLVTLEFELLAPTGI